MSNCPRLCKTFFVFYINWSLNWKTVKENTHELQWFAVVTNRSNEPVEEARENRSLVIFFHYNFFLGEKPNLDWNLCSVQNTIKHQTSKAVASFFPWSHPQPDPWSRLFQEKGSYLVSVQTHAVVDLMLYCSAGFFSLSVGRDTDHFPQTLWAMKKSWLMTSLVCKSLNCKSGSTLFFQCDPKEAVRL